MVKKRRPAAPDPARDGRGAGGNGHGHGCQSGMRGHRGRTAIGILMLHQPLRQTEGALRSIADLLGVQIRIPDHTTFSRRGGRLKVLPQRIERDEPLHLLIDSTGVKIYGEGEWLDQKHGIRSRRCWRKLHLAVDADTQEIAAVELTPDISTMSAV
jgi:hypothetical protein